VGNTLTVKTN